MKKGRESLLEFDKMADELMEIFKAPEKHKISESQETALYYAIEALLEKYYNVKMMERK